MKKSIYDLLQSNTYDNGQRAASRESAAKSRHKAQAIAAVVLLMLILSTLLLGCSNNTQQVIASASPSVSTTKPSQTKTPVPTATPAAPKATPKATVDPNNWRAKFADKFSQDGKVYQDDHSYKSANINVNITKNTENGVVYFVTDIYIADIKYFKTAFGGKADVMGGTDYVYKSLKKDNGIIGINADYSTRNPGLIIHNGTEYKKWKKSGNDELVMYSDGTMKDFKAGFKWDEIRAQKPYQAWGFGPILLDDKGQAIENIDWRFGPRTAIGYYEPGHYCFVVVDGRQKGYSDPGYTLTQTAQLMNKLGCKLAFNLDGGGSSQLAFLGKEYNKPCPKTYRKDSDLIYITDND